MKTTLITLLLLCAIVTAFGSVQTKSIRHFMSSDIAAKLPAEHIDVSDLIQLTVANSPELSRSFRVDSLGNLNLPMLKNPVQATGLTPVMLRDEIAAALRDQHLLKDPIVDVSIEEHKRGHVTITGAVLTPTTVAPGGLRLFAALASAGGISAHAGRIIIVQDEDGTSRDIPISDLFDGLHPELNAAIDPGARVFIPEAEKVFVIGDVRAPGAYRIFDPEAATVLHLLALSGWIASENHHTALIYRNIPATPQEAVVKVPLRDILDGQAPDTKLMPGDILYVTEHECER